MVLGLVAVVAVVVWVGGRWGASAPSSRPAAVQRSAVATTPAPEAAVPDAAVPDDVTASAPTSADGWRPVVVALYQRRAQAFSTGAASLLGDVYAPGSPALAADVQAMGELAAAHREVRDFAPAVTSIDGATVSGDTAELRLADRLPSYAVVDADGAVVSAIPGRDAQEVRMTLVRTVAGWRIRAVVRTG